MWWTCYRFLGSQFVHNIYKPLDNLDEFIDKYKDDYEKQTIGVGGQSKTIVKDNSKKTWDFKPEIYLVWCEKWNFKLVKCSNELFFSDVGRGKNLGLPVVMPKGWQNLPPLFGIRTEFLVIFMETKKK